MIKALEKRLFLFFMFSIMGIFTFVFCLFIHKTIKSEQETEASLFSRSVTMLVFQLENSSHVTDDLQISEQANSLMLLLEAPEDSILYQSAGLSEASNASVLDAFYAELQNVVVVSVVDDGNLHSSQNGTLTFSVADKGLFYGTRAAIITKDGSPFDLYALKAAPTYSALLKKHISFFLITWLLVFFTVLLVGKLFMKRAMKPTNDTLQSQKEFIAAVSHELKSPLAVILASAEAMEGDSSLPPGLQKQTRTIDAECLRMSQLIQDLLLLSSIDTNIWSLNKTAIDVDTLLIDTFEKYGPLCRQKNLRFQLAANDTVYPALMADRERIEQILGILIDNAINYSPPASEICLAAVTEKNRLVFSITDHGTGICDADKPFIYDRFYCTDKSRTQKNHFGLGLSIAKELVKMHNGTIELSDTPGGGCTFRFSLPVSQKNYPVHKG